MMNIRIRKINWEKLRSSSGFHNLLLFLVFVVISALFWVILALNDNVQDNCEVKLKISGVPDSVTFITLPPDGFHVTVRDKGSTLLRSSVINTPSIEFDFKEYAEGGVLRLSHAEILSSLKGAFGAGAQFSAVGLDSLRLNYVTGKGKRVPVVVDADVSAEAGNIISSPPVSLTPRVEVFAERSVLDTITRVYTTRIVKRDLSESRQVKAAIRSIPGARVIPDEITVRIEVEPLVSKDYLVEVEAIGVPEGINLLLFPSKVKVSCFVPMSDFSEDNPGIRVYVDYKDIGRLSDGRLPLKVSELSSKVHNVQLTAESVEYTVVK